MLLHFENVDGIQELEGGLLGVLEACDAAEFVNHMQVLLPFQRPCRRVLRSFATRLTALVVRLRRLQAR